MEGSRSSWVAVLQCGTYRDLTMEQRVAALSALCHAVMEGPAVRAAMDARLDEAHNRRRLQWQEAKARSLLCSTSIEPSHPGPRFALDVT